MTIKLATGVTSVSLKNLNDGGYTISFTNCTAGDTIYMHSGSGIVTATSTTGIFDKWNKNLFRMVYGWNNIEVTGACEITVTAKYPLLI